MVFGSRKPAVGRGEEREGKTGDKRGLKSADIRNKSLLFFSKYIMITLTEYIGYGGYQL